MCSFNAQPGARLRVSPAPICTQAGAAMTLNTDSHEPSDLATQFFARQVAAGCAAHSDHGRTVAEVFMSVARKESHDYTIKDEIKLLSIAPYFDVATTVDGKQFD